MSSRFTAKDNLLPQSVGEELLLYDPQSSEAFCLKSAEAEVFMACQGGVELESLQERVSEPRSLKDSLAALLNKGLVSTDSEHSRRAFLVRASAVAGVVLSVSLPRPAAAQSGACGDVGACSDGLAFCTCCADGEFVFGGAGLIAGRRGTCDGGAFSFICCPTNTTCDANFPTTCAGGCFPCGVPDCSIPASLCAVCSPGDFIFAANGVVAGNDGVCDPMTMPISFICCPTNVTCNPAFTIACTGACFPCP